MAQVVRGNPVIINEAPCFPANPELIAKSKRIYVLALFVVFVCCIMEAVEAQIPPAKAPAQIAGKEDASRRTVRLAYKLARGKARETGIFLSADSAALISPGLATRYRPAVFDEAGRGYQVDFNDLEPDKQYFYKIFTRDRQDKITWSEITAVRTPGFNIRWTGVQKWLTANNAMEITLTGESVDMVPGYYQVFYAGKPCELLRITGSPDSAQSYYAIRLPHNTPPGRYRLVLMYKHKTIFDQDIEVL